MSLSHDTCQGTASKSVLSSEVCMWDCCTVCQMLYLGLKGLGRKLEIDRSRALLSSGGVSIAVGALGQTNLVRFSTREVRHSEDKVLLVTATTGWVGLSAACAVRAVQKSTIASRDGSCRMCAAPS